MQIITYQRKKSSKYLPKIQMVKFCNKWKKGSIVDRKRYLRKIGVIDQNTLSILSVRSYVELDSETRFVLETKTNGRSKL